LKISILLDTHDSFLHEYIPSLIEGLVERGHSVKYHNKHTDISSGEVLFLLGCKTILSSEILKLHKHTLVVHPSKLPEGRGSAALVWKILEGKNKIYLTLFEANEKIDKGDIYIQEAIIFNGYELSEEIRCKQAKKTIDMVLKYIDNYKNIVPHKQIGKSTFVRKRTFKDSELDVDKSIREQFNLLRIADNKRYPAFFNLRGHRYSVKIYRDEKI
jgi:methionyl-tRNA formyltransferase